MQVKLTRISHPDESEYLTVGKVYTIKATEQWVGGPVYTITDDRGDEYATMLTDRFLLVCPHCGGTFDKDDPENVGEYETDENDEGFFVSIICPNCDEYVDIEQPEPNE